MKNLNKLSNNDIEELLDLCGRLVNEINTYSHVSDVLPSVILKQIESFQEKCYNEQDKRNEFN